MIHFLLSFIEGPKLPKTLHGHSSVTLENELIVLGGLSHTGGAHFSSSIYKMTLSNGIFSKWIEMEARLKTPRAWFVASFIPNDLISIDYFDVTNV